VERLLITADAVGGVWRYTVDLGRELAARGVRITVAVMGPPPSAAQREEAASAGMTVVARPYRLEWMDEPWADVERAGAWLLELEQEVKPSIVHLNGYAHAAWPWRAPVAVVAHSCVRSWWRSVKREPAPPAFDRYSAAVRAGLCSAGLVVAPTTAMAQAIDREYGGSCTLRVIPNGRPARPDADALRSARSDVVFVAARAWDEAKNVAALRAIADEIDWPIVVAGDTRGPDGRPIDLRPLQLLGSIPAGHMAGWYRRAAIYALPARYEPFGLSVLEAAAAGCALVLGDIASLRENWDGAALFVPPDDRSALLSAIRRLIGSPRERLRLGRAAFEHAAAFTIDRTADEYLRSYRALVA
jgi:glycosyltransferase involved in cell wall biosynthesis